MAAPKTKKETVVEEVVETSAPKQQYIYIDKVPGEKIQEDVVFTINGKRYQMQRGVKIPVSNDLLSVFEMYQRECDEAERIEFSMIYDD